MKTSSLYEHISSISFFGFIYIRYILLQLYTFKNTSLTVCARTWLLADAVHCLLLIPNDRILLEIDDLRLAEHLMTKLAR